jgi:hypothetical protein
MAARTPRVVFSNTDFAKLDREDKEGRALFQRLVILTFADRDVQIETKLRLKYFKAGTGWDLEQLRADVAELEAAAGKQCAGASEAAPETWAVPPGDANEWDSSDEDDPGPAANSAPNGEAAASGPAAEPMHVEGFEPSANFVGPRDGLVFKTGAAGVGYYKDTGPLQQASPVRTTTLEAPMASLAMPIHARAPVGL